MKECLNKLREFMVEQKIDCLLVNSTNKFLVEYNDLEQNSRYLLTGFSGSTGDALVTKNDVYLFVDGRYHIQAELETDNNFITLVKLETGQSFLTELIKKISNDQVLGIFSEKVSQSQLEFLKKNIEIKLLNTDPLDRQKISNNSEIVELPKELTGLTTEEKLKTLDIKDNEAVLLTNLDDVSYIFNLRDFSKPFSSKVNAKAVLEKDKATIYYEKDLPEYETYIKNLNKRFIVDKSTTNALDYSFIEKKAIEGTPVKQMKAIKTEEEIEHYKYAFAQTDKALLSVRKYIEENENISEYDIAKQLELEFIKHGAKSLSFNSIVAKDKNSALAHYSKSSKTEIIKDGSLILIDCGAYFEGGLATDITRVFIKGTPTNLHKTVYTKVLQAFLKAYNTKTITNGYDIDNRVREFLKYEAQTGVIFNHGLGHGIGINVHEAPPNLGIGEIAKTPLKNNMCFTIEPGLYNSEHFGIRLENSCYIENNTIKSFVRMPYENKLIDYAMLSKTEIEQLNEFGVI